MQQTISVFLLLRLLRKQSLVTLVVRWAVPISSMFCILSISNMTQRILSGWVVTASSSTLATWLPCSTLS